MSAALARKPDIPAALEALVDVQHPHRPKATASKPRRFGFLDQAWLDRVYHDRELSPRDFKVAFAIARYAGQKGAAWPKQETLATEADLSVRTIRECLEALVERGHLSREKKGIRNLNAYRLRGGTEGDHGPR